MNVLRFSFHDPWTVIGAWTAIRDGPVIVDHCVENNGPQKVRKIALWTALEDGPLTGYFMYFHMVHSTCFKTL